MKAKDTSQIGMIVGAVCLFVVMAVCLFKFIFSDNFGLTTDQSLALILMGIAPSIPFCPVYISIWLDKIDNIKNKKFGGE